MKHVILILLTLSLICLFSAACSPAPEPDIQYDPAALRFSGERAFQIEEAFVTKNTHRVSGSKQAHQATEWLLDEFSSAGWQCAFDDWEAVLYSETVMLRNVVCRLEGESDQEILVMAHHDIAPTTIRLRRQDFTLGVCIRILLSPIADRNAA